MCKQIKKCEPLIEFVPFGMRMPQINYLTINVLKPERCDVYFLVEKATQFYNCLDSELSNENKLVLITRYLQQVINRKYS